MSTSFHKDQHVVPVYNGLPSEKEVHALFAFEYADRIARLAATGFVETHVGKVALQHDDGSFWVLLDHAPITWKRLDSTSWVRVVFTATAGQTSFTLPSISADADSYTLSVNGVEYVRTMDYTVSGTALTWLNNPFALIAGDRVMVAYEL
jgi:hypothetical protein